MFNLTIKTVAVGAGQLLLLFAAWGGAFYGFSRHVRGEEPVRPAGKADALQQLRAERMAVLHEIAKQTTEAWKAGTADYQQVSAATQALHEAELEQCESDKERIAVLQKIVGQAKEAEQIADRFGKAGTSAPWVTLKAKADRLQAEIELEKTKTKVATHPATKRTADQTTIVETQVAVQQTAVKMAEAQKQMAVAQLESSKAQLAAAQAAESFTDSQLQRYLQLSKSDEVVSNVIDERREQFEARKARRIAAESEIKQCEARVLLEDAHVERANLELEEAKLRLAEQKSFSNRTR